MTARDVAGKAAIGAGVAGGLALAYMLLERRDDLNRATVAIRKATGRLPVEEAKAQAAEVVGSSESWLSRMRDALGDWYDRMEFREKVMPEVRAKAEDLGASAREKIVEAKERAKRSSAPEVLKSAAGTAGITAGSMLGTAKLKMEKGTSAIGAKAEDVRSSVGHTVGGIGDTFGDAVGATKDATFSLAKTAVLGAALAGLLVYIYAPEREQQRALWQRVKSYFAGASSTARELGSMVSREETSA